MTTTFHVTQTSWEADKKDLIRIRTEVFINEQLVPPDLEWDGYDRHCWQVIARAANGEAIGTARLLYDGHIGRMAVLPPYRLQGVGSALLHKLLDIARQQQLREVFLHAQIAAIAFYEKHGFTVCSDEFMDAGIPHVTMKKPVTAE
jgi:predicted GNAT family N-acyltransferase